MTKSDYCDSGHGSPFERHSPDLDFGPDGRQAPVPSPEEMFASADEGREADLMLHSIAPGTARDGDAVRLAIGRTARLHSEAEEEEEPASSRSVGQWAAIGLAAVLTAIALVQVLLTSGDLLGGLFS